MQIKYKNVYVRIQFTWGCILRTWLGSLCLQTQAASQYYVFLQKENVRIAPVQPTPSNALTVRLQQIEFVFIFCSD